MADSISEGTLTTIHKKVGDRIEADEEIASIETDKIDVAVNAAQEGVVAELLAHEGDVVTIGQPIARIEPDSDDGNNRSGITEKRSSNETARDALNLVQNEPEESKSVETNDRAFERSAPRESPAGLSPASSPQPVDEYAVDSRHESSRRAERVVRVEYPEDILLRKCLPSVGENVTYAQDHCNTPQAVSKYVCLADDGARDRYDVSNAMAYKI